MKIVVIGGTGLIGFKVVAHLRQAGHEVVAASPGTGVNSITGEGLSQAMAGTQVVVGLANSPSFEERRCWTSSKPRAATSWPRRSRLEFGTMSVFPSSERTGHPTTATSAPRSPKRN